MKDNVFSINFSVYVTLIRSVLNVIYESTSSMELFQYSGGIHNDRYRIL